WQPAMVKTASKVHRVHRSRNCPSIEAHLPDEAILHGHGREHLIKLPNRAPSAVATASASRRAIGSHTGVSVTEMLTTLSRGACPRSGRRRMAARRTRIRCIGESL